LSIISDPQQIEKKSFEIIEGLLAGKGLASPDKDVIVRVVHATADPDFADAMRFSPGAAEAGIAALRAGCAVITDVKMLKSGISMVNSGTPSEVFCFISDDDTADSAKEAGTTRAAASMRKAHEMGLLNGAIVAIGNAPTALFELIRLVQEEGARPALVIGVPVGFVGAAESKEELAKVTEVPFITCLGKKGGSPVGASALNALIKLAKS
jgi:precorrin-8X/cobalt-precorrin-8 methylmutase